MGIELGAEWTRKLGIVKFIPLQKNLSIYNVHRDLPQVNFSEFGLPDMNHLDIFNDLVGTLSDIPDRKNYTIISTSTRTTTTTTNLITPFTTVTAATATATVTVTATTTVTTTTTV